MEVQYNGVTIHGALTTVWEEQVVYDGSDTDVARHHFRLRFEGLIHSQLQTNSTGNVNAPIWTAKGQPGSFPADAASYESLASAMGVNRQTLTVINSDHSQFFLCSAATRLNDPNRDVDNGPKPRAFNILNVYSSHVLRVSFEIECCKLECLINSGGTQVPPVLTNRWSVEESADVSGAITRNVSGSMRLSAPAALLGDYRALVFPILEIGFRRDGMVYCEEENGLEVRYRITDSQVHDAAPWPFTDWECVSTVGSNDGVTTVNDVHAWGEAPLNVQHIDMIARLMQILDARTHFIAAVTNQMNNGQTMIENIRLTEHFGKRNRVEASLRLSETWSDSTRTYLKMLNNSIIGQPLSLPQMQGEKNPYDPQSSPLLSPYGYDPQGNPTGPRSPIVTALLQCYYNNPCDQSANAHQIYPAQDPDVLLASTDTQPNAQGTTTQLPSGSLPDPTSGNGSGASTNLSASAMKNAYTHCSMECTYDRTVMRVALPICVDTSSDYDQDTTSFVQLSPPQIRRIIRFDCECVGAWPQIPAKVDTYTDNNTPAIKGTLLHDRADPHPVAIGPGGIQIYRVSGEYIYGLNRDPVCDPTGSDGVDPLNTAVMPYSAFVLNASPGDGKIGTQYAPNYNAALGP